MTFFFFPWMALWFLLSPIHPSQHHQMNFPDVVLVSNTLQWLLMPSSPRRPSHPSKDQPQCFTFLLTCPWSSLLKSHLHSWFPLPLHSTHHALPFMKFHRAASHQWECWFLECRPPVVIFGPLLHCFVHKRDSVSVCCSSECTHYLPFFVCYDISKLFFKGKLSRQMFAG